MVHIVTEGRVDALLLSRLLEPEVEPEDPRVRVVAAGGWSLADSTARSILAVERQAVALAVDADSTMPEQVSEHRRFLEESLAAAGATRELFRVFLFVPEIEILLFSPGVLEQLAKRYPGLRSADARIEAKYAPKKVLERHGIDQTTLVRILPSLDLDPAKATELAKELRAFVFDSLGIEPVRKPRKGARSA